MMNINIKIELEQLERNKIDFANNVISIFDKYKDIDSLIFSVDDYIFSLTHTGEQSQSYIKEKTSLNKIGFISYKHLSDLSTNQINSIMNTNKKNLETNLQGSLFYIIYIGNSLLIKSPLDTFPLEPSFSNQLMVTENLENLLNNKIGCPVLNEYLQKQKITHLLEDYFLNQLFDDIKNITNKQCLNYPLFKLGNPNRKTFNTKRVSFYRDTLDSDILTFYGVELISKIRAIELFEKLKLNNLYNNNICCKKKI